MMNRKIAKRKLAALAMIGVISMAPSAFAGDGHANIHCESHRHCGGWHPHHRSYCWYRTSLGVSWGYPWYNGYEDYGYADYGYSYPNPYYVHPYYRYCGYRNRIGCGGHTYYGPKHPDHERLAYHASTTSSHHNTDRSYSRQ